MISLAILAYLAVVLAVGLWFSWEGAIGLALLGFAAGGYASNAYRARKRRELGPEGFAAWDAARRARKAK